MSNLERFPSNYVKSEWAYFDPGKEWSRWFRQRQAQTQTQTQRQDTSSICNAIWAVAAFADRREDFRFIGCVRRVRVRVRLGLGLGLGLGFGLGLGEREDEDEA